MSWPPNQSGFKIKRFIVSPYTILRPKLWNSLKPQAEDWERIDEWSRDRAYW